MAGTEVLYLSIRRSGLPKQAVVASATFTQLTDQPGPEYFPSLSPDGKSFVYASNASGNWDIYFQRVGGKNPINLTKDSAADDTQPAFSPDGEQIAFRSERDGGGIFVMGATGESVKRLTDFGYDPAWSPDGKEIACADDGPFDLAARNSLHSRVWAINVASGEKWLVTKEDSIQPNWSPHGDRIAYIGRNPVPNVMTIPADGGNPIEVTNEAGIKGNPVWSPDGKYVYFVSDRSGSMNVWRVPFDEQSGKVLGPAEAVNTPSPYSAHLSFSRNGKRMVYSEIVRSANLQVGFDPTKETIIGVSKPITQGYRLANWPDLSPDGEWLAFDSRSSKQEALFVINKDGGGQRQVTDGSSKDRQPHWAPDGKRLAFYSDRSGKWEIWVINADGSGQQQLTNTSGVVSSSVWSPDGSRLAYRNENAISIIDVRKAWQDQKPQTVPATNDSNPWIAYSWSPDGNKIAGTLSPQGLVFYSLDSKRYERLTDFGYWPAWLSDNRRLLFQNSSDLYLIDSQSKKFHKLLSVAPQAFNGITLSRDDRVIYFSVRTVEADVWMMTMSE